MAAKPLTIGLVLDDGLDKPDGVQQYILAVGGYLQRQGHDVHYLVGETKRTDLPNVHSLSRNINVRFNGNRLTVPLLASRRRLRKFLRDQQFDVLHVQVPYHPFMAHQLIKAAGPGTVIIGTFHIAPNTGLVTVATKVLGIWLRSSLKRFDTMLSVSQPAADFCKQTFGVDSEVCPNVFDYYRFHDAQPVGAYADGIPTILFFGRLVPRKGCRLLLEAVNLIRSRSDAPKFKVIIGGTGPLRKEFENYTEANGLRDIVQFVGFVTEEDKPRLYASADIAVFPSQGGESFGIVLLEAMASGRAAVLAGDNSGYRSVMAPREELLFDPRDSDALADKLLHFLTDTSARQAAAEWGAGYSKGFDTDTVGARLVDIYESALQKRRKL